TDKMNVKIKPLFNSGFCFFITFRLIKAGAQIMKRYRQATGKMAIFLSQYHKINIAYRIITPNAPIRGKPGYNYCCTQ
ncbi:hypothetical protein, partial [Vibrio sp. V26_P1S5P106]|uniref:hypothetical protein n=1 Tax=Vibrio sp. V26_P1S5P106 TaxID=1938678 RepID=UPI001F178553